MFDLDSFFTDFKVYGGTLESNLQLFVTILTVGSVEDWDALQIAISNVENALKPKSYQMIGGATPTKRPTWTRRQLVTVMELLKDHPFVLQKALRKQIGEDALHSLISYNILFPRPTSKYTFDIPNCPSAPIIVAPSPLQLAAMRRVLASLRNE